MIKRLLFLVLLVVSMNSAIGVTVAQEQEGLADVESISPYPLRVPRLTSPRDTIKNFLLNANEAVERWRDERPRAAIRSALRRALSCLDLSNVPITTREVVGTEKMLLLKEILDRIEIPPLEDIPGDEAVANGEVTSWTIPNTEITITKLAEGPRAGSFVFNENTINLLPQYYDLSKHLPYKPESTIGAYEDWLYGPGSLLPRSWFDGLHPSMYEVIFGQTLWQWIALALLLMIVAFFIQQIFRLGAWWDNKFKDHFIWSRLGKPISCIFVMLTMAILSILIETAINITGDVFVVIEFICDMAIYAAFAYLLVLAIIGIGEIIIHTRHLKLSSLNTQVVRILSQLVAAIAVLYVCVIAAESFGVPVAPLIAGLGVGGLAIALAVRPTLENIVGGFILFADKPVKIGDFCSFGNQTGTIEEIGLRSTRIRALDRTVISIPNAVFANMEIVNWARCDRMLIKATIGLRYETTPDQLRYVLANLREMFHAHPRIDNETIRVRFSAYGASSLDISIRVYALTREWNDFYAIKEDVLMRVNDIVSESGSGFAFPSQTLYMGKDDGLDKDLTEKADKSVKSWRRLGRLPFPRLSSERIQEIEDTLDYPPKGSVELSKSADFQTETEGLSAEPLSEHMSPEEQNMDDDDEERPKDDVPKKV